MRPSHRPVGPSLPPVVEAWASYRTFRAGRWAAPDLRLLKAGATVSVVLPARDEQDTVATIVRAIRRHLMDRHPLVDELVVVDSHSTDRTAEVAAAAGATVVRQGSVFADLPALPGKGAALWTGLAATSGDVVVFADADVRDFRTAFVTGLLGPLLADPSVQFVKGCYRRPLVGPSGVEADAGGRVTELAARPLLNLFWPELSGFIQPLAGEYAGRRAVFEAIPFASGYGVEIAMLIDLLERIGLDAMAQVDLGERTHPHQDNHALGRMSAQIMLAAWSRLRRRGWVLPDAEPRTVLAQFRLDDDSARADVSVHDVAVPECPPLSLLARGRRRPRR